MCFPLVPYHPVFSFIYLFGNAERFSFIELQRDIRTVAWLVSCWPGQPFTAGRPCFGVVLNGVQNVLLELSPGRPGSSDRAALPSGHTGPHPHADDDAGPDMAGLAGDARRLPLQLQEVVR